MDDLEGEKESNARGMNSTATNHVVCSPPVFASSPRHPGIQEGEVDDMEGEKESPCNARGVTPLPAATNHVVCSPPTFASSPRRPVAHLLSRSLSIWSSAEKDEQNEEQVDGQLGGQGQGLGLSILREGGEETLSARILAALVDCCFCA